VLKRLYTWLFVDDLLQTATGVTTVVTAVPLRLQLARDLSRLTLFAYILYFLNPVMPLIADKMAHTFWEEYHLITVHGVYGQFHTRMQIEKAEKQAEKDKTTRNQKTGFDDHLTYVFRLVPIIFAESFIKKANTPYRCFATVSYPDVHYQPPRA